MIDWTKSTQTHQVDPLTIKTAQMVVVTCEACNQSRDLAYRKAKYTNVHKCKKCASKEINADPITRSKIKAALIEKHQDPAYKAKLAESMNSEEYKQKQSDNSKRAFATPEARKQMSERMQKVMQSPSRRLELSNTLQQWWAGNKPSPHALTTDEFVGRSHLAHNHKYEYHNVAYVNSSTAVTITCKLHGDFDQNPRDHMYGFGCPKCGCLATSSGQAELIDLIKSYTDAPMMINDRMAIKPYELDIYLPSLKLAFEFNGAYWHSYNERETAKQRNKHMLKSNMALSNGIRLIHIYEHNWLNESNRPILESMIKHKLCGSERIYARNVTATAITTSECDALISQSHLQGKKPCTVAYGLIHNKDLISCMSFTDRDGRWEIERYATKTGYAVIGGASKLFAAFVRKHTPSVVHTYADRDISDAGVYIKLGFKHVGHTQPGYLYLDRSMRSFSRHKCQKHKLSKLLGDSFDPNLSEPENMFKAGYRRMWNSGNHKLTWTPVNH